MLRKLLEGNMRNIEEESQRLYQDSRKENRDEEP